LNQQDWWSDFCHLDSPILFSLYVSQSPVSFSNLGSKLANESKTNRNEDEMSYENEHPCSNEGEKDEEHHSSSEKMIYKSSAKTPIPIISKSIRDRLKPTDHSHPHEHKSYDDSLEESMFHDIDPEDEDAIDTSCDVKTFRSPAKHPQPFVKTTIQEKINSSAKSSDYAGDCKVANYDDAVDLEDSNPECPEVEDEDDEKSDYLAMKTRQIEVTGNLHSNSAADVRMRREERRANISRLGQVKSVNNSHMCNEGLHSFISGFNNKSKTRMGSWWKW
jgi:hypothetical protein